MAVPSLSPPLPLRPLLPSWPSVINVPNPPLSEAALLQRLTRKFLVLIVVVASLTARPHPFLLPHLAAALHQRRLRVSRNYLKRCSYPTPTVSVEGVAASNSLPVQQFVGVRAVLSPSLLVNRVQLHALSPPVQFPPKQLHWALHARKVSLPRVVSAFGVWRVPRVVPSTPGVPLRHPLHLLLLVLPRARLVRLGLRPRWRPVPAVVLHVLVVPALAIRMVAFARKLRPLTVLIVPLVLPFLLLPVQHPLRPLPHPQPRPKKGTTRVLNLSQWPKVQAYTRPRLTEVPPLDQP